MTFGRLAPRLRVVNRALAALLFTGALQAQAAPKPEQVYVIPFSHLDIDYHGPYRNSLARFERVLSAALDMVEKNPDYRYTIENASFLSHYLEVRPEYRSRIKAALAGGRLDLGAQWADIIQNAATAEDLVRNVSMAAQFARRNFGFKPRAVICADMPGFTAQIAQVWAASGVLAALRTRGGPLHTPIFKWKSPEGSGVRIGYVEQGYASGYMAGLGDSIEAAEGTKALEVYQSARGKMSSYKSGVKQFLDKYYPGTGPGLLLAGGDNIFPMPALPGVVSEWNRRHGGEIHLQIATASEFGRAEQRWRVPEFQGDMQSTWMPAATSLERHANTARTSHKLLVAEKVAALASLLTPMPYPREALEHAWGLHLVNLDHEGGALPENASKAQALAEEIQARASQMIASRIRSANKKAMVVAVINPLGWERRVLIRVPLYLHGDIPTDAREWDHIVVRDERGQAVPARLRQTPSHAVIRTVELTFEIDLPPLGYRAVFLEPAGHLPAPGEAEMEIAQWKAVQDPAAGAIESGPWKAEYEPGSHALLFSRSGQPLFRVDMAELPNAAVVPTLESDQSSKQPAIEWQSVRKMERWKESSLRLDGTAGGAAVTMECRLRAGAPPELATSADWNSNAVRMLVQRVLPAGWSRETVRYGIPFGELPYGSAVPGIGPTLAGDERPPALWKNLKEFDGWVTWQAGAGRVAMATEGRGAYFSSTGVQIVLMPTPRGRGGPLQRQISLQNRFDFYAAGGDQRPERLMWDLAEEPVVAVAEDRFADMPLAAHFSLMSWNSPDLVVTAVKRDAEGRLIVRTYAHSEKSVQARLTSALPLANLESVSPTEEVRGPASVARTFRPWQIQTLRATITTPRPHIGGSK